MKKNIIIRELALDNLMAACSWYEDQQTNLGVAFVDEWEDVLEFISLHPDPFRKRYKNFQLA